MTTTDLDAFARLEHEGWQRVASRYETAWSALTRAFIPRLLQAAGVARGSKVLDVACGPGYVAEAARALGAQTLGIDFSSEMVRLARARNPELKFREGDAQRLDLPDAGFDTVLMNFGLLHLARPEAALAEAHRVLRPGGCYAFTVWAGPERSEGARLMDSVMSAHADLTVSIAKGPDRFHYASREACASALAGCGFATASLRHETATEAWLVPSASFLFEAERHAGVRTAAILAAQSPERLRAIAAALERGLRGFALGEGFAIPYSADVVAIRKP